MNTSPTKANLISAIVWEVTKVNRETRHIILFSVNCRRLSRYTKAELKIVLEQVKQLDGKKIASQVIGSGPLRLQLV